MANLEVIRTALASVIQAAVPTVNVSPVYVAQINPPQIVIDTAPMAEDWATFEGSVDFGLRLLLIAGAADEAGAQETLDGWIASDGGGSVVAAIATNPRLVVAGQPNCDYCVIQRIGGSGGAARGGYGVIDWSGIMYIGTMILLDIAASQQ